MNFGLNPTPPRLCGRRGGGEGETFESQILAPAPSREAGEQVRLSRPLFPAAQVVLLLGGQLVDLDAHRLQLVPGDVLLDLDRHVVHRRPSACPCSCTQYSVARACVAKLMSMTLGGWPSASGQVHQPAVRRARKSACRS